MDITAITLPELQQLFSGECYLGDHYREYYPGALPLKLNHKNILRRSKNKIIRHTIFTLFCLLIRSGLVMEQKCKLMNRISDYKLIP